MQNAVLSEQQDCTYQKDIRAVITAYKAPAKDIFWESSKVIAASISLYMYVVVGMKFGMSGNISLIQLSLEINLYNNILLK